MRYGKNLKACNQERFLTPFEMTKKNCPWSHKVGVHYTAVPPNLGIAKGNHE